MSSSVTRCGSLPMVVWWRSGRRLYYVLTLIIRLYELYSRLCLKKYFLCSKRAQKISPTRFELVTLRLSNYSLTLFQLSYGEFALYLPL